MRYLALRLFHWLGLLIVLVNAHGYLSEVIIDGKPYAGNLPNANPFPSAIQQIDTVEPNYGADNPSLLCGHGARVASEIYDANPGSTIEFDWEGGDGSNWPHNIGPMLTYMASCGSTPCNQFDPKNARWFKIFEVGRERPGGDWVQQQLMDGGNDVVKIPATLAPGNYLIRHEIIALHIATRIRGAEFYAGCVQLRISGSQTGKPDDNELVTFPGAYEDDHPGIFTPNVFDVNAPYTFPGPPIAKFIGAQPSPSNPSGPPASANSSSPSVSRSGTGPRPTQNSPNQPPPTTQKVLNQKCRLQRKPDTGIQTVFTTRAADKLRQMMKRLDFRGWTHGEDD